MAEAKTKTTKASVVPLALLLAGCVTLSPEAARVSVYSAPLDGPADRRQMPDGCRRVATLGQEWFSEQLIEGQTDPYRRQRNAVAAGGGNVLLALMRQTSSRTDPECPNGAPIRDCGGRSGAWYTVQFESYACTPEGLQALPVPKKNG